MSYSCADCIRGIDGAWMLKHEECARCRTGHIKPILPLSNTDTTPVKPVLIGTEEIEMKDTIAWRREDSLRTKWVAMVGDERVAEGIECSPTWRSFVKKPPYELAPSPTLELAKREVAKAIQNGKKQNWKNIHQTIKAMSDEEIRQNQIKKDKEPDIIWREGPTYFENQAFCAWVDGIPVAEVRPSGGKTTRWYSFSLVKGHPFDIEPMPDLGTAKKEVEKAIRKVASLDNVPRESMEEEELHRIDSLLGISPSHGHAALRHQLLEQLVHPSICVWKRDGTRGGIHNFQYMYATSCGKEIEEMEDMHRFVACPFCAHPIGGIHATS
jgi:DNA-directed RNA polymerase subunit RPC12/RpoP